MSKFMVMYIIPAAVVAEWRQTDPETRKDAEDKMRQEWDQWMRDHASMILSTEVGGKTKQVDSTGISDTKNDIILFSFIEAASHEAATEAFKNHPHLQIQRARIEVMEVKQMGG